MPWFNVDDGFAFHRKVVKAGNAACGLWVRAGSWSAKELTDGFVPDHMVSTMGTPAQARRLVDAGLWTVAPGGYQFHQWTEVGRNPTKKVVTENRKRDADKHAEARKRGGQNSRKAQVGDACPVGTDVGLPLGIPGGVDTSQPNPTLNKLRLVDESTAEINSGSVVAVWVGAFEESIGRKPPGGMRGQVGREASALLAEGCDPRQVLEAARSVATRGMATLQREYYPMAAKGVRTPTSDADEWRRFSEQ